MNTRPSNWAMKVCMFLICAGWASAAGFGLAVGSPVAANAPAVKSAQFVVRAEKCAEPAKVQISGTAEGLVNSSRRSVALQLRALPTPGVFAIFQQWPEGGKWVVSLTASCLTETAGAIIPVGPKGFIREASKFFPRSAKPAEVEEALK